MYNVSHTHMVSTGVLIFNTGVVSDSIGGPVVLWVGSPAYN